jgi:hypothetical protein
MSVRVTSQAFDYSPHSVKRRYVRYSKLDQEFRFCEVGEHPAYDIRQGIITEDDLPEAIASEAKARYGQYPSYVFWPIQKVHDLPPSKCDH